MYRHHACDKLLATHCHAKQVLIGKAVYTCVVIAGNSGCCNVPIPAHQSSACRPVLSPVLDRPGVSASVPCHRWTPPGYPGSQRQYPGGEMSGGGGVEPGHGPCPASPYPSPPLSTHGGRGTADLRWSPVSQLGADDSWTSCGGDVTVSCRSQLRSSPALPGADCGDVMAADFELLTGQNSGRQNALTAYTGMLNVNTFVCIS